MIRLHNHLDNQTIKVSKRINGGPRRPGGPNNEGEIKPKGDLPIDWPKDTNLRIIIGLDTMPSRNQKEGVKIIPGSKDTPHHIEFKPKGNVKYEVVLHYKDEKNGINKTDVDPKVEHPNGPS